MDPVPNPSSLAGRVAVVTGASRGLGRVLAQALSAAGALTAPLARPSDALDRMAHSDPGLLALPCDVTDPAQVEAAFARVAERLGPPDILVNNAAVCQLHRIEEASEADVVREVSTNLLGPLWCARAAIPHMRRAGRGDIVNISSESVRLPFPYLSLYAATKAGLETLSEGLRNELRGEAIRVTVLRSGNVAGGELARHWTIERQAAFFAAIQASGRAAFAGAAMAPQAVARALLAALLLPQDAGADLIEVRAAGQA